MTDRDTWQRRHAEAATTAPPSPFVERWARKLAEASSGARALDVACGLGRHSRLLADLGFETVAVDFATAAVLRATGVDRQVRGVAADATRLPFRPDRFDLVVQTCFLERSIFPALARLVRPGGHLIVETFSVRQFEETGHPRRAFCLEPGELERLCEREDVGLEPVKSATQTRAPDGSPRHLEGIIAHRP